MKKPSTIIAHHDEHGRVTDVTETRLKQLGERIRDQAWLNTLPPEAREPKRMFFPKRKFIRGK